MALAPSLCINVKHSGSVQVGTMSAGGSFSQIGPNLNTAIEGHAAGFSLPQNLVTPFPGGRLVALVQNVLEVYDPVANSWTVAHTATGTSGSSGITYKHSGLHVIDDGGTPTLVYLRSSSANVAINAIRSTDLVSFSDLTIGGSFNILSGGIGTGFPYRGLLYLHLGDAGGNDIYVYNPSNNTATLVGYSADANSSQFADWTSHDSKNLFIDQVGSATTEVFQFISGSPVSVHTLTSPQVPTAAQGTGCHACLTVDPIGGNLLAFWPSQDGSSALHWNCAELIPNGSGGFTQNTIGSTVLPADWQNGGAKALATSMVESLADDESTATAVELHISYLSTDSSGGIRTTYKWNGIGVAMGPAVVTTVGSSYAISAPKIGDAPRFYVVGDLGIAKTGATTLIKSGKRLTFTCDGDPLVLAHGAVTGGPFAVGEVVTGGTSSASATVTKVNAASLELGLASGTFVDAELLTGGTSGATATTNAAPTGGAADKTVKAYSSSDEGYALAQFVLRGSPTGGTAIRVVDEIQQVIADGLTEYTLDVDIVASSIAIGSNMNVKLEVSP